MAPRASWKGYIKLSLVSCPVRLYPAVSANENGEEIVKQVKSLAQVCAALRVAAA